jgi:hypothetical protein
MLAQERMTLRRVSVVDITNILRDSACGMHVCSMLDQTFADCWSSSSPSKQCRRCSDKNEGTILQEDCHRGYLGDI